MIDDITKGKWSKDDMCSKMFKENSDIITKLSEETEKNILQMFLNSEEVNLFIEETDKKKLSSSVTASIEKTLLEDKELIYPLLAYDDKYPGGVNILSDPYESEKEKNIKKATESPIWKLFKQNTKESFKQFLIHGPGKTNINLFRGAINLILDGQMTENFIIKFGKIYNADNKFQTLYNDIMTSLSNVKEATSLSAEILAKAKNVVNENNYEDYKTLGDIAIFIVTIMQYYENLILNELNNKSFKHFNENNLSSGIRHLNKQILECFNKYKSNDNRIKCFADKYITYVNTNTDPIGPLLVLIYCAIPAFNLYSDHKTSKIKLPKLDFTAINNRKQIEYYLNRDNNKDKDLNISIISIDKDIIRCNVNKVEHIIELKYLYDFNELKNLSEEVFDPFYNIIVNNYKTKNAFEIAAIYIRYMIKTKDKLPNIVKQVQNNANN